MNQRVTPRNPDAEKAILGALLLDNRILEKVEFLDSSHFCLPAHQRIFQVCKSLIENLTLADINVLESKLPPELEGVGNTPAYLKRLLVEATMPNGAVEYAKLVYELSRKQSLILLSEEILNQCYDRDVDLTASQQIEQAEQKLYKLAEKGKYDRGFVTLEQAANESVDMIARAYENVGGLAGLPTYLTDVDEKMGGMQKSDLIILAGRPGMGKTALATTIAFNTARSGEPVGFFSLEMSSEQLATRIIAEQSGIASNKLRRGKVDGVGFDKVRDAADRLRLPMHIDEAGGITVGHLAARARRLKRQKGLSLLVVDYLQLMKGTARRQNENRVNEVTEITTSLKALAKELDVPILALSQLSRAVEARDDKRPQLSDLRESGSIEQDADVVMFLYREAYYVQMRKPDEGKKDKYVEWQADLERTRGKAELIISKQRHGPTGTVELQFDDELTKFSNLYR